MGTLKCSYMFIYSICLVYFVLQQIFRILLYCLFTNLQCGFHYSIIISPSEKGQLRQNKCDLFLMPRFGKWLSGDDEVMAIFESSTVCVCYLTISSLWGMLNCIFPLQSSKKKILKSQKVTYVYKFLSIYVPINFLVVD